MRKRLLTITLTVAFCLSLSSLAFAMNKAEVIVAYPWSGYNNTSFITQAGDDNYAYQMIHGFGYTATQVQSGYHNDAKMYLTSHTYPGGGGTAKQYQYGDSNWANIDEQSGGWGNYAWEYQDGNRNDCLIGQYGSDNMAYIGQYGNNNLAGQGYGAGSLATPLSGYGIFQSGNNNWAKITQNDNFGDAGIFQSGNGNSATITQNSNGDWARVTHSGNGNTATIIQN